MHVHILSLRAGFRCIGFQKRKEKKKHFFFFLYSTVIQHDGARPHAVRSTILFLANNNVPKSPLALHVPRLNPNKHSWNELERRVRGRVNAPANMRELFQAIKQEWVANPAQAIYNLVQPMPERFVS